MPRTVLAPLLVLLAGLVPSSPLAATAKAIPRLERVEGRHRLVAGRRLNGDERWVRLPDEGAILRVRLRLP